jgi:hypothetical protein
MSVKKGDTLFLIDPAYPTRFCTLQGIAGKRLLVSFQLGGRMVEKLVERVYTLPLSDEGLTIAIDAELERREIRATEAHEAGDPTATLLLSTYEIIAA